VFGRSKTVRFVLAPDFRVIFPRGPSVSYWSKRTHRISARCTCCGSKGADLQIQRHRASLPHRNGGLALAPTSFGNPGGATMAGSYYFSAKFLQHTLQETTA
jgi:hypothetical protein